MHVTLISARTLVALSAGGLLLSGCGSSVTPAAATAAHLRDKLPESVRKTGVLKVGSDLNYAPVEFKGPDGAAAGLDPELATALGKYLGLNVQFVDMPFEKLIPAVQSKEIDLAMSAVIDTRLRQDGRDDSLKEVSVGVDFIDYFMTGTSILVKNGNPENIASLDDLCGRTIAMQRGTLQALLAQRQTNACGKISKTLKIHLLDNDDQALNEVASGTAVADLNDYPIAEYNTQSPKGAGKFQVINGQLQPGPYGITLNKDNTALRDTLAKALDQLIRNGEYDKILTKWNVHSGAVPSAVINGGF